MAFSFSLFQLQHGSRYEGNESHQGCHHQLHGVGRFRAEEEWCLQDWWLLELEAQEKASSPSSQGSESIHQGAMRVQGQASLQNSPRLGYEEVEGDDQLND